LCQFKDWQQFIEIELIRECHSEIKKDQTRQIIPWEGSILPNWVFVIDPVYGEFLILAQKGDFVISQGLGVKDAKRFCLSCVVDH
jgi:hypothetical protein